MGHAVLITILPKRQGADFTNPLSSKDATYYQQKHVHWSDSSTPVMVLGKEGNIHSGRSRAIVKYLQNDLPITLISSALKPLPFLGFLPFVFILILQYRPWVHQPDNALWGIHLSRKINSDIINNERPPEFRHTFTDLTPPSGDRHLVKSRTDRSDSQPVLITNIR